MWFSTTIVKTGLPFGTGAGLFAGYRIPCMFAIVAACTALAFAAFAAFACVAVWRRWRCLDEVLLGAELGPDFGPLLAQQRFGLCLKGDNGPTMLQ